MVAPFWGRPCISCIILFPASSKIPKPKIIWWMNEWMHMLGYRKVLWIYCFFGITQGVSLSIHIPFAELVF